jgi:hypothetical protein
MDEWEENEASKRPYRRKQERNAPEQFAEGPVYHVERHEEDGAYVGHGAGRVLHSGPRWLRLARAGQLGRLSAMLQLCKSIPVSRRMRA